MTTPGNAQWLSLVQEDALDPGLPVIDPHHHLWNYPDSRYVAEDFLQDTASGHDIVQSVFVECLSGYRDGGPVAFKPVGETETIRTLAARSDDDFPQVAAGIVGFADLTLGAAVNAVLAAHVEAGEGRFRGIRHASGWDRSGDVRNSHTHPPAGLLSDKEFRRGFACLDQHGLSFDAWLYHPQIPELTALARAFPDTSIILDHVGGPLGIGPYAGKRDAVFNQWMNNICELAECKNISVKLGGLAMKICGFGWHTGDRPPSSEQLAAAWGPYYHFCIEKFGVERCMFESNFPVCSADERAVLFHDTAARVYRLAPA